MKVPSVFLLCSLLCELIASGQGTLRFSTRILNSVDARMVHAGGSPLNHEAGPVGSLYVGQLYAGPVGTPSHLLQPVGQPTPFRDAPEAARGYIIDGEVVVPGVPPGELATVKLVAWQLSLGSSYVEVLQSPWPGDKGESAPITLRTGGGLAGSPANLVGLHGFTLTWIPEPPANALMVLGALLVFARPRQR